jgi:hypothetical protein
MATHGVPINGVRSLCAFNSAFHASPKYLTSFIAALDDPSKEVKVVASDGRTGAQKDIAYTNCRVIGNGSFGIVFQARMVSVPKELEDIAIKKVLQDKRFKVRLSLLTSHPLLRPGLCCPQRSSCPFDFFLFD